MRANGEHEEGLNIVYTDVLCVQTGSILQDNYSLTCNRWGVKSSGGGGDDDSRQDGDKSNEDDAKPKASIWRGLVDDPVRTGRRSTGDANAKEKGIS